MVIIIEGCDGTGKTTLARKLEREGFIYRHNGVPENTGAFEFYTQQVLRARGQNVVFDRLHVGELVYGPVMRGKSLLSLEEFRLINRLIFGLGGLFIFCDTDDERIKANWTARRKNEYVDDLDKLWDIADRYQDLMSEFGPGQMMSYDYVADHEWTVSNLPEVKGCPEGVIGSPYNRFLIVGERSNATDPLGPDLPFYSTRNSSHFLNESLWAAGYQEPELAFTNAFQLNGQARDLAQLYRANPRQIVITLGREAADLARAQEVPTSAVLHPAWWLRFRSKDSNEYVQLLRDAGGKI